MAPDYLQHIRDESTRFVAVLDDVEPTADVPACPGWNAADLLWHLGEVQYFWAKIVRDHVTDPDGLDEPDRPEGYSTLVDFFRSADDALLDALGSTTDDVPVWTFTADKSVGWVRRRQAHEALIHRVDAELTAGTMPDIDPALAADGVAEVLEWMYSSAPDWAEVTYDGPVGRVDITDVGEQRLVQVGRWGGTSPRSGKSYADQLTLAMVDAGEPQFDVSGPAADLDLWLWNRPIQGEVTLSGETNLFERIIATGVQ